MYLLTIEWILFFRRAQPALPKKVQYFLLTVVLLADWLGLLRCSLRAAWTARMQPALTRKPLSPTGNDLSPGVPSCLLPGKTLQHALKV